MNILHVHVKQQIFILGNHGIFLFAYISWGKYCTKLLLHYMHTCGTYSNLAVSGSISKSSRTGDFGMLSRYLSEKQRVYDYEKISNTMCCNLLTTLGQLKLEKLYIDILLKLCVRENKIKDIQLAFNLETWGLSFFYHPHSETNWSIYKKKLHFPSIC